MKALVITVAVLITVTGCGSTSTAQHVVSTPAAVASAGAALSCRLPIGGFIPPSPKGQPDNSIGPDGFANQKGTGGFLQLPAGTYTQDPASDRSYESGTWLPALPQAASPDGKSYASARGASVYLTDVRTRTERMLHTWSGVSFAQVLAFTAGGIYVQTITGQQTMVTALYLVRPDSGAVQSVPGAKAPAGAAEEPWLAISGGAAWGMLLTLTGTAPNQQPVVALLRLDLATGEVVKWWDAPGALVIEGFDSAGHPLISTMLTSPSALTVVTAPGQVTTVQPQGGTYLAGRPSIVSDSHGAWLGSLDGSIWLYTTGGVLEKVASVPPQAGGTGQPFDPLAARSVAGPCV